MGHCMSQDGTAANGSNGGKGGRLPPALERGLNSVVALRAGASWPLTIILGAALVAAGALLRLALLGPHSERAAYLTFWPVVMLAALIGGAPAGATAVVLSASVIHFAFIPLRDAADWIGLGFFLVLGGVIVCLTDAFVRGHVRELAATETQSLKSHLASIVETSDDAILSLNLDGIILSWNAAATRLFGYSAAEIVGRSTTPLLPADRLGEEGEIIDRLKKGERVEHYETRRVAKDGRLIDVSLTISPVRDGQGAIVAASKIIRDFTERRSDEARLRAAQQRAELATETTCVGVWEWSVKTNLAIWDAQMFRIYGMEPTPDGIVSYDAWAAVVLPEDLRQQEMLLRTLLRRGGVSRREFRIRRPSDNEIRVIEMVEKARQSAGGAIETCVGTNLDVTEIRRADTALRLSRGRLRHAADAARLTYLQFDLKNNRVELAENFEKIMGYKPSTPRGGGTLQGARMGLTGRAVEADRTTVSAMFDDIFSGVGGKSRFRVLGDDHLTRWVESVANSELDRNGRLTKVFVTLLDVTSIVEKQSALEAANAKADEILASIGDGFFALDPQSRFSYFNRRAEDMLGKRSDEVLGRRLFEVFSRDFRRGYPDGFSGGRCRKPRGAVRDGLARDETVGDVQRLSVAWRRCLRLFPRHRAAKSCGAGDGRGARRGGAR